MVAFKNQSQLACLTTFALLACGLCGCGGTKDSKFSRSAVDGTVLLDGTPVPEGIVKFVPLKPADAPATAVPFVNGEFSVTSEYGPVVGQHRIEVISTDDGGFARDDEQALTELAAMKKPPTIEIVSVPALYRDRSPLQEQVREEGPNTFHFELETPKRSRR